MQQDNETQHPPHVQRMFNEARELVQKVDALERFMSIENVQFLALPTTDKSLLLAQASAMGTYLANLTTRISRATGEL